MDYIDLKYKPNKDDLICEYYIEPNNISIKKACNDIAAESSIGTWTNVSTMNKKIMKLRARVFSINGKYIKIAYPSELFELGNMPEVLSSVAGNIFGMKSIKNLRLMDIEFPKKIINSFKGPKFGINGIRKNLGVKNRPLLGTIIKPKIGLDYKNHARVAYEAWIGGCDVVKDDENLSNQNFNLFKKRIVETLRLKDKAEKETGEKKAYLPNITAETSEMVKRGEFVKKNHGNYLMLDIITLGWSSLQTVRNKEFNLPLHAHRAGHAILTRNKKHGISMLTIAKIARLIGVDSLHIGTAIGKMEGSKNDIDDIEEEIEKELVLENKKEHFLEQKWYNIKPIFAVCSGGLHPRLVPRLIKIMGNNIIIQAGGGVHGNKYGTVGGAKAMKDAIEASIKNIPLSEYSKNHKELKSALEQWK
ncbi:MAG: type III ribulose-bisphosphate carboxylase [Candidatus Woesearchaeota archaeon]|nr:type III ribulose-bisphosphate carboxylase [Candidatus Woesearchaeota archaeon]